MPSSIVNFAAIEAGHPLKRKFGLFIYRGQMKDSSGSRCLVLLKVRLAARLACTDYACDGQGRDAEYQPVPVQRQSEFRGNVAGSRVEVAVRAVVAVVIASPGMNF